MAIFKTVIKDPDFISLHVPAQDKPVIGKKEFAMIKKRRWSDQSAEVV
ncbi:MAG: hypothetical protein CM15mP83_9490 [Flavobacteriaceae bacterium]|nr:MAG: hypothetical protein CM15mP83_9490 [Flavobacteriaceae bacterium]